MKLLLSIDPATHGCGLALWVDGALLRATYVKNGNDENPSIVLRCSEAAAYAAQWARDMVVPLRLQAAFTSVRWELACELPQIYRRGANKTKGDPNKIVLPLAMVNCALAGMLNCWNVIDVQPHAWKGTTEKPDSVAAEKKRGEVYVIKKRVLEVLTPAEQKLIDWTGSVERSWDVADGIGVGLHALGRFERARRFARE